MESQLPDILFCRCLHRQDLVPAPVREALEQLWARSRIWVVDDLCRLVADHDPRLPLFARHRQPVIVACHARAVRALFESANAPLAAEAFLLNLRESPAEAVSALASRIAYGVPLTTESDDDWHPWFPVIDRTRCTNCKQCLNFCLFNTYTLDAADRVAVTNPRGCKTNCPACARICPAAAIIFPKYDAAPIDGSPITNEPEQRERIRVDTRAILGSDVYAALRKRRAGRSLLSEQSRSEQEEKARLEREAWKMREQEGTK